MSEEKGFQNFDELETMLMAVAKESPTYQKIAMYIEKNYLQIIFMTANELADNLGISQGSVSRFFIVLGYHGYNDFLRSLQKLVSKQLTAPQRLQYSREQHKHADNPLRTTLDVELANMDELTGIMHGADYEAMVDMVTSPKKLVLLSARMAATILPYVEYILQKMRGNVSIAVPGSLEWELLETEDLSNTNFLAVTFPRYPNVLVDKCALLHEQGAQIAVVTDSRFSPVIPYTAASVLVPVTTASLFDIYSTPLAFFNLLLRDAARNMPQLTSRMEKIESAERRQSVYFSR